MLAGVPGVARDLVDAAIAATKTYRNMRRRGTETEKQFEERQERRWDEILTPIDELLDLHRRAHLRAVREAGRSGPQVPDL
jgi:hypothetical protein